MLAVFSILFGMALALRFVPLMLWAVTFSSLDLPNVPVMEAHSLHRRFGAAYDRSCRRMPGGLSRQGPLLGAGA